jgi:hypothetical protein
MCVITPILTANACDPSRAGITVLYVAQCSQITDLTFDADRMIEAITMTGTFKRIEFEKNTAFFNQAKTRNKSSVNVAQTISIIEAGLTNEVRNALEDLNCNCCLFALVKDNSGIIHAAGISYNSANDTWAFEDMRTGEGSANTGADPTADSAEFIETLVANVRFYANQVSLAESSIPVSTT